MTRCRAEEMTREQFAESMRRDPIVVLPIGAMEEHGDHLPLGTDTYQVLSVVERLAEKLDLLLLPALPYGECRSTYNFPGTISISFDTLRALAYDILAEIFRHGGRRVLVISGHAGRTHMHALRMAAERIVKEHPEMKVMVLSDYDLLPGLDGADVPEWDGHAGMVETSRMLGIRPDISSRGKVVTRPKDREFMILPDPERLFPSGVAGDPRRGSAELGRTIDDHILRSLKRLIGRNLRSGGD